MAIVLVLYPLSMYIPIFVQSAAFCYQESINDMKHNISKMESMHLAFLSVLLWVITLGICQSRENETRDLHSSLPHRALPFRTQRDMFG